ncbi:MAG: lipid A phosphoethanolamine transferase [Muribaculaceae bacterium]|nr:lipid A phosphoethanolamine transferase [Muribaculaceae bacterium]
MKCSITSNFKRFIVFWFTISLIYSLVFVTIEFAGSPFTSLNGFMALAMQWACVALSASAVIMIMAANRWIFALLWPPFIMLCSVVAYYKLTFDVSLTAQSLELALINNAATWATVITAPLVATVLAGAAFAIAIVWFRFVWIRCPRPWLWAVAGILILIVPGVLVPRLQGPVFERLPLSIYSSVSQYIENRGEIASERTAFDAVPAVATADSLTVVFVIGESLRADHLQLNGYHRATTPYLASDTNLVSFPRMRTIPFFTHTSVPYIVSRADSLNQTLGYTEPSFITLFCKAGFHTTWLSNQDSGFAYLYFMHEADSLINLDTGRSPYNFSKWLDADLLPHFSNVLDRPNCSRQLIVMHTIGSHWWYPTHYTDSETLFTPEVQSRVMSEVTPEEMINSYDNTIVATDRFLHAVIDRLHDKTAILIFISDHGEALGEDGHFLHADDYEPLHHPACFVWWTNDYASRFPQHIEAMKNNSDKPFLTDAMFHTVLEAAGIETPVLKSSESLMRRDSITTPLQ